LNRAKDRCGRGIEEGNKTEIILTLEDPFLLGKRANGDLKQGRGSRGLKCAETDITVFLAQSSGKPGALVGRRRMRKSGGETRTDEFEVLHRGKGEKRMYLE